MTDLSTIEARKALATKYAAKYLLDPVLLCALVEQESSWNTWACRYEPLFYSKYIQPLVNTNQVHDMTEAKGRATSYGLGQTMGQTARELGFTGRYLTELCDPDVSMEYAAKKLRQCMDRQANDVHAALQCYNGGGDPSYGADVLDRMSHYQ